jgi:hypothetical protein
MAQIVRSARYLSRSVQIFIGAFQLLYDSTARIERGGCHVSACFACSNTDCAARNRRTVFNSVRPRRLLLSDLRHSHQSNDTGDNRRRHFSRADKSGLRKRDSIRFDSRGPDTSRPLLARRRSRRRSKGLRAVRHFRALRSHAYTRCSRVVGSSGLKSECRFRDRVEPASRQKSPSVKPVKMMDRPVAVADAELICCRDRGADPGLGVADGSFHIFALRESRCNR